MLANQAAHILAVRTGFTAEAGCVGDEFFGQFRKIQYFSLVNVRDRHFRGRYQVIIGAFHFEKILGEFGKISCAEKACRIGHERRQDFLVAVIFRMDVQHEIDQRPFHKRAGTAQKGKTRACDFGCAIHVQDPKRGSEIHVIEGCEVKRRRLSPSPDFAVPCFIAADGNGFVAADSGCCGAANSGALRQGGPLLQGT